MGSLVLSQRIRLVKMKFLFGTVAFLFVFTFLGVTSLHIADLLSPDCGENNHYCEQDTGTCCHGLETTRCGMTDGTVGCCPIKDGVCCKDSNICCFPGLTCVNNGNGMECSLTKPVNMTDGVDIVPGFQIIG